MRLRHTLLVALAIFSISTLASHADTLYSNFGPAHAFTENVNFGILIGGPAGRQIIADAFVPTESATLTNVVLPLTQFDDEYGPVNLYIESSLNGGPGAILATLTQVGDFSATQYDLVDFTCSSCLQLGQGVMYYVVAQQSDPLTTSAWAYTSSPMKAAIYFDSNGSATGPWTLDNEQPQAFEVDGTPVAMATTPEPSSLLLLGTGILGLAGATRRRIFSIRGRSGCDI